MIQFEGLTKILNLVKYIETAPKKRYILIRHPSAIKSKNRENGTKKYY